jgi:hypothetical protein
MDSNDKNISPVDPLPPYLSVALMYCPGVHANSVHACNAGNVNGRLNVSLESCAWLEPVLVPVLCRIHEQRAKVDAYNL